MSDAEHDLGDKVEHLRKMRELRELRETIEQMRREVKEQIEKLSGLRLTSYNDAIEWLTAHNAALDSFRGLCAAIDRDRSNESKVPS